MGLIGGGAFLANTLRKKLSFFNKVEEKLIQKQEEIKQTSPNLIQPTKESGFINTLIRKVKLFIAYLKQKLKNLIS